MLRDVNPEKLGKYLILYHNYPCNLISMERMGTFIGVLPVPLPFALNPSSYGEGRCTPPHVVFRPLLNKQYIFIAVYFWLYPTLCSGWHNEEKKIQKFSFNTLRAFLGHLLIQKAAINLIISITKFNNWIILNKKFY